MAIIRKYSFPFFFILLFYSFILLGCTSPIQPATSSTPAGIPTPTENAPTVETRPAQQNLLVIQCSQPGQIKQFEIQSEKLRNKLIFSVYFPPCYGNGKQENYPVLFLLHGQTFDNTQWQRLGLLKVADQLVQSGHAIPFLVVMPYEQFYYRSPDGNTFPQALTDELIPWVETNLHARSQKAWRAVGGISRGASWAVRLGLQQSNLFSSVGGHSLPTFNGDVKQLPNWLDAIPAGQAPRIYIDIGRSDPEVDTAIQFEHVLNQHAVLNEWHLNEGYHDENYWLLHIQEYLDWYTLSWQIHPD